MLATTDILVRLLLAAVLGSIIGIERERLSWAAGLRTHMLVCVGATLFMIVSAFGFADILGQEHVVLDPSRVAAQVVSGIGFLGAGTILLRREVIRGLTTAASLWTVAAVGLAVGGGLYLAAVAATVLILLILAGIKPLERRFWAHREPRSLIVIIDRQIVSLTALESAWHQDGSAIKQITILPGASPDEEEIQVTLSRTTATNLFTIVDQLRAMPGVRTITVTET
jgi:putative Mg2+ transporter-C (MgtC) family protein